MRFERHTIKLKSIRPIDIIDITDQVKAFAKECNIQNGMLAVVSTHTTVCVFLNESCERLQEDMLDFFEKLAPSNTNYLHNSVTVDGRPNAHSHLLSLILPSQMTIVLQDGELNLGQWQSVFAVDLDGPRQNREINLTLMGE
jgi:secondary thiamine-phosphate synthase enzyme